MGIIGTVVATLCCFTPILVVILGALGLSRFVAGLDLVLFPALGIFMLVTGYALWKRRGDVSR
ncbi:MAG: hypothetical protein CL731_04785 [Chloroflexi bacterium]|nr:hypothetical protein [Chloroflexota bacterium]